MVKPLSMPKKEEEDVVMAPPPDVDYGGDDEQPQPQPQPQPRPDNDKGEDSWRLPNFVEGEAFLRESIRKQGVHPVDPITVASKSDPIPLKDLSPTWLTDLSDGWYGGHDIRDTLLNDKFHTNIEGVSSLVCRWAVNIISDKLRNPDNLVAADLKGQFDRFHGSATIQAKETCKPSELPFRENGTQTPIIGIRVLHGGRTASNQRDCLLL